VALLLYLYFLKLSFAIIKDSKIKMPDLLLALIIINNVLQKGA